MMMIRRIVYGAAVLLVLACEKQAAPPTPALNTAADSVPAQATKEIIWAGLQGTAPRYIETGDDAGLGYDEVPSKGVRTALKDAGYDIKMTYMTSNRLDLEMRSGHPICTYPVEWIPANEDFSKKPNRLLSIALDWRQDEPKRLIVHARAMERLAKHRDEKGNINLDTLIKDKSMRAMFVQNRQLPEAFRKAITLDERKIPRATPGFEDHVYLLTPSENKQVIAMLNADRFDYTLAEFVEAQDFAKIKTDRESFAVIDYSTEAVSDISAARTLSVACSVSPTTIAAMPVINSAIKGLRSHAFSLRQRHYHRSFDEAVEVPQLPNTISYRFAGAVADGISDVWFTKLSDHLPALKMHIAESTESSPLPEVTSRHEPGSWLALMPTEGELWIMHSTDWEYLRTPSPGPKRYNFWRAEPKALLVESFSRDSVARLAGAKVIGKSALLADLNISFKSNDESPANVVVFGTGMSESDETHLASIVDLSKISRFTIVESGQHLTKTLIGKLNTEITSLSIVSSAVFGTGIMPHIAKMKKLRRLVIHNSPLPAEEAGPMLSALPSTLEELDLGWQPTLWTVETALIVSKRKLPKLRILNLESSLLTDRMLLPILSAVGLGMEELKLNNNRITSYGLLPFLARKPDHLTRLEIDRARLSRLKGKKIVLPPTLKHLSAGGRTLQGKSFSAITVTSRLESLRAFENDLDDAQARILVQTLAPTVSLLDLGSNRITGHIFSELRAANVMEIETLNLSNNRLRDDGIDIQKRLRIRQLDVEQNVLRNKGVTKILESFGAELESLYLCDNMISSRIIANISKSSPKMKVLALCDMVQVESTDLKQFPPGLVAIDLTNNGLGDVDIQNFAANLPPGLRYLNLVGSRFGEIGAHALAQVFPPLLYLHFGNLQGRGLLQMISALPPTLHSVSVGGGVVSAAVATAWEKNIPARLKEVSLWNVPKGLEVGFLGNLPNTLQALWLRGSPISKAGATTLIKNWPKNLRQFAISAAPSSDESAQVLLAESLPATLDEARQTDLKANAAAAFAKALTPLRELAPFPASEFHREGLNNLLKYGTSIRVANLIAAKFDAEDLAVADFSALKNLQALALSSVPLNGAQLLRILRQLPEDCQLLSIPSTKMEYNDVDAIIAALPKNIAQIAIAGNNIGEAGFAKFRAFAERREREDGLPITIE